MDINQLTRMEWIRTMLMICAAREKDKNFDAFSRKCQKNSFFDIFFDLTAVNMQKSPYSLYKSCRQWSIESIYEFSAESSHAFSRKSPKTSKNLIFGHKRAQNFFFGFFGENPASSLFYTWNRLTCCKKAEKSNGRKYENFYDGQTDGRTDGQTGLDT